MLSWDWGGGSNGSRRLGGFLNSVGRRGAGDRRGGRSGEGGARSVVTKSHKTKSGCVGNLISYFLLFILYSYSMGVEALNLRNEMKAILQEKTNG